MDKTKWTQKLGLHFSLFFIKLKNLPPHFPIQIAEHALFRSPFLLRIFTDPQSP